MVVDLIPARRPLKSRRPFGDDTVMAWTRKSPQLITVVLAAALAAGPALAAAATHTSSTAPVVSLPPTPAIKTAQATVLTTQDLISTLSAELAAIRNAMATATRPAAIQGLMNRQQRLQALKVRDISRLGPEQHHLNALIAAQAEADAASVSAGTASTLDLGDPQLTSQDGTMSLPAPGTTAADIDTFLASWQSPLTGLGAVFVADAEADGVDPRLLVAISGAETSFGTYVPSQLIHNPFGLGPGRVFPTWAAAIQFAADTLGGSLYRGSGLVTIPEIQARWAPLGATNDPENLNSNWRTNVEHYYQLLGGNPTGQVISGGSSQLVSLAPSSPAAGSAGPAAATTALTLLGVPNSADSPDGLNDGQLVQTVYADNGIELPDTVAGLWTAGSPVTPLDLRAGDAVFFGTAGSVPDHVGIYLGGGEFIHAPGPGQLVQVASLYRAPWRSAYLGARRYSAPAGS